MVKISIFFKCFAAPFELKELLELFWKQFAGADRGATHPYKSISRGGWGLARPYKLFSKNIPVIILIQRNSKIHDKIVLCHTTIPYILRLTLIQNLKNNNLKI